MQLYRMFIIYVIFDVLLSIYNLKKFKNYLYEKIELRQQLGKIYDPKKNFRLKLIFDKNNRQFLLISLFLRFKMFLLKVKVETQSCKRTHYDSYCKLSQCRYDCRKYNCQKYMIGLNMNTRFKFLVTAFLVITFPAIMSVI